MSDLTTIRAELEQAQALVLSEGANWQDMLAACTGRLSCDSPFHYHGCFADTLANCTDPEDHPVEVAAHAAELTAAYRSLTPKLVQVCRRTLERHEPRRQFDPNTEESQLICGYDSRSWPCPDVETVLVAWEVLDA